MSYNCIANSTTAQSKLFLRPSGREKEIWMYREPGRLRRGRGGTKLVTHGFEPFKVISHEEMRISMVADGFTPQWVTAVTLCPLLELEDREETTALGRLEKTGLQQHERANLVAMPAEDSKYANMILTDPPIYEVEV